ncbi:MAG: hypothetical protein J7L41_07790 [Synergistetes bacterium]|nr:hypothetical protein [Synergistota bacterium]
MQGFELEDFEKVKEALFELKPELIGRNLVFLELKRRGYESFTLKAKGPSHSSGLHAE